MRFRDQKGLTGLEIMYVGLAIGALFTFVPQLNPIAALQKLTGGGSGSSSSAAGQKATWTKQDEIIKIVKTADQLPADKDITIERHYNTGTEEKAQILTYGQQVAKFFAGLSTWGLVLVVMGFAALFFLFGITPGMVWRNAKKKAEAREEAERLEKEKYKKALTQTVEGIRAIDDKTTYEAVTTKLKDAQDKDVKATIDIVKSELHK